MRGVFERGLDLLKEEGLKDERVVLLDSWRDIEAVTEGGDVSLPDNMRPEKIKKRRMVTGEDGKEIGWEEYYDYVFPGEEEEKQGGMLGILEKARQWKAAQEAAAAAG